MKESQTDKMLRLMSDGAWYSTAELVEEIGHRFSAPMHILRKRGYKFDRRYRRDDKQNEFRLMIDSNVIA